MNRRLLIAFDFDNTIADDNTDCVIRKLLPDEKYTESVKSMYLSTGWTAYMGKICELLHENGITAKQIIDAVENIPAAPGMDELLNQLYSSDCETIVISDANSLSINHWLRCKKLDHTIARVFTNPARFDGEGVLKIEMYHKQDWCKLSSVNLCKGYILEDYIQRRKDEGVEFEKIAYVGDGRNDFCPVLKLSENDLAFPRNDFPLQKILNNPSADKSKSVSAKIVSWSDGMDIWKELNETIIDLKNRK
ncbi:pyridoxal phosphate phosphatase PHOSPHO2 [Orussus abietinus]|uniref:pyridoxal phosphate phosphatase PHOSPHO2 n=1 Tax=Orussus abietinus TaxID=222816 RepID=UPI000626752C|nr:pyridoxal phosphate phosphatase PHOSPHO2 [Orussus abietinus]XP_023288086.1 pyridoxal phosphate phosphatase PHOSPHO2 [Orussus abietinus]